MHGPISGLLWQEELISDTGPCLEWLNVLQTFRLQLSCSGIPQMLKAKAVCKCLKNAPLLTVKALGICYCLGQLGTLKEMLHSYSQRFSAEFGSHSKAESFKGTGSREQTC